MSQPFSQDDYRKLDGFTTRRKSGLSAMLGPKRLAITFALVLCSILLFARNGYRPSLLSSSSSVRVTPGSSLPFDYGVVNQNEHIQVNGTFGFERIYVVNMARRTDKKAEMTILAHQYGLSLEFVEGVDGGIQRPELSPTEQGILGCSESHAKGWQKMLADGVSSALMVEDDVDFDVRIFEQLAKAQAPFEQYLARFSPNKTIPQRVASDVWHSTEWDVLWLGTEKESVWPTEEGLHPYMVYDDTTVEDWDQEQDYVKYAFDYYGYGPKTKEATSNRKMRLVQQCRETFATHAYAISASGAKKLLYNNAHKGRLVDHIDFVMHDLANRGKLRSHTFLPGFFAQYHGPQGLKADSDREHVHVKLAGPEGESPGIVHSAKKRLEWDIEADMRS